MRWYCKICKLFTEVDNVLVCEGCREGSNKFNYCSDDDVDNTNISILVDQISENLE